MKCDSPASMRDFAASGANYTSEYDYSVEESRNLLLSNKPSAGLVGRAQHR